MSQVSIDLAVAEVRARIARARTWAGESPWLAAYDAVGIQNLIAASNRPKAMRGASEAITAFDAGQQKYPGTVVAGGGRGFALVQSEEAAWAWMTNHAKCYEDVTHGAVLATAAVPFERGQERNTLTWLRHRLDLAKDSAPRPRAALPTDRASQCADCSERLATQRSPSLNARESRICGRCAEMLELGGRYGETRQSLNELTDGSGVLLKGWVGAISADGNNMGALFQRIGTLEELALASEAVTQIFRQAHRAALEALRTPNKRHVSAVTGGDDIRVFVAPEDVLTYVPRLVFEVEQLAEKAADHLRESLGEEACNALRLLGVGVGAVIADAHTPVRRLLWYAHELEDHAKALCRREPAPQPALQEAKDPHHTSDSRQARQPTRSAFDFRVLASGDVVTKGDIDKLFHEQDGRPLAMSASQWAAFLEQARALREVPPAQRAILTEARHRPAEEFANMFLYQVARSRSWQQWFKTCQIDLPNREELLAKRPSAALLDALRILPKEERP